MLTASLTNTHAYNRVCPVKVVWWAKVKRIGQDEWKVMCPVCGQKVEVKE